MVKANIVVLQERKTLKIVSTIPLRMIVISSCRGFVMKTYYLSNKTNATLDITDVSSGVSVIEGFYSQVSLPSCAKRTRFKQLKYLGL